MTIQFPMSRVKPATAAHEPAEVLAFPGQMSEDDALDLYCAINRRLRNMAFDAPEMLLEVEEAVRRMVEPGPRVA